MYVKENTNVKNKIDLQNLVASVILCQQDEFTLEDVVSRTNSKLIDTAYYGSEELRSRCSDVLHTLFLFGSVESSGKNKYVPTNHLSTVSAR